MWLEQEVSEAEDLEGLAQGQRLNPGGGDGKALGQANTRRIRGCA